MKKEKSMQNSSLSSPVVNPRPNVGLILSLSVAHIVNDWYMNYLQVLLPFLVLAGFSVSKVAFLISVFTITSSLLQPVFGYLVDRKNLRWLVNVGTAWMAVLLGLVGLVHQYGLLLCIVGLAGLGTAAFHPQASAMVAQASGARKGFWQALFIASGNVGWALAPLLLVPVVQAYGLSVSPVFAVPGIFAVLLIAWISKRVAKTRAASDSSHSAIPSLTHLRSVAVPLLRIMGVAALRSWTYFSLIAFLPLYLQVSGYSLGSSSHLLFVMLFAGAMGGLIGGALSDHFRKQDGRRRVLALSLLFASPLFAAAFATIGSVTGIVLLGLAGACLLASFSITVVLAQATVGRGAAFASGLMLGFGIGLGGLGVGLVGILVERFGAVAVLNCIIWLPFVTSFLAWTIHDPE